MMLCLAFCFLFSVLLGYIVLLWWMCYFLLPVYVCLLWVLSAVCPNSFFGGSCLLCLLLMFWFCVFAVVDLVF